MFEPLPPLSLCRLVETRDEGVLVQDRCCAVKLVLRNTFVRQMPRVEYMHQIRKSQRFDIVQTIRTYPVP